MLQTCLLSRIDNIIPDKCPDCDATSHNVAQIFNWSKNSTRLKSINLWRQPVEVVPMALPTFVQCMMMTGWNGRREDLLWWCLESPMWHIQMVFINRSMLLLSFSFTFKVTIYFYYKHRKIFEMTWMYDVLDLFHLASLQSNSNRPNIRASRSTPAFFL